MSLAVDNPIINSPFDEPIRLWNYKEGQPVMAQGRRPAGYYLKPRMRGPQMSMFEEEFVPLETVNIIRDRVRAWRERKFFSASEKLPRTLTWLVEASLAWCGQAIITGSLADGLSKYAKTRGG